MSNHLKLLDNEQLKNFCRGKKINQDFVVIDVREPVEYAREHIPGSVNIPVTDLRHTDFSAQKDKIAIFHCKLGNRTRTAQDVIATTGFKEIYCMSGGIEQWKACGLTTEVNRDAPIDVMRQVQIIAGILILLGVILAVTVAPAFIWLSGLVGLGLLMAGITGFCGMAKLLMLMPWNKIKK